MMNYKINVNLTILAFRIKASSLTKSTIKASSLTKSIYMQASTRVLSLMYSPSITMAFVPQFVFHDIGNRVADSD